MKASNSLQLVAAIGLATFVACAAPDITGTDDRAAVDALLSASSKLIECKTDETHSTSGVIGIAGGVLSTGGVTITIPPDALLSDVVVNLTVPASKYVETDISIEGTDHFEFELPVTVAMSYSRCTRTDINLQSLSAWYIDSNTKQLLAKMPSVDDKLLRTVTFTTDHLSGYAIAN